MGAIASCYDDDCILAHYSSRCIEPEWASHNFQGDASGFEEHHAILKGRNLALLAQIWSSGTKHLIKIDKLCQQKPSTLRWHLASACLQMSAKTKEPAIETK